MSLVGSLAGVGPSFVVDNNADEQITILLHQGVDGLRAAEPERPSKVAVITCRRLGAGT